MTTLYLPPYPFPIRVFTNKEEYKRYALKHGFFEKPVRDVKDIDENLAEVIDSDNNPELGKEILMHLPSKGELSEFEFEETIDHEVIHVVFSDFRSPFLLSLRTYNRILACLIAWFGRLKSVNS